MESRLLTYPKAYTATTLLILQYIDPAWIKVRAAAEQKDIGVRSNRALAMSIAVAYHPSREDALPVSWPRAGRIARVAVFDDMRAAEPFWRTLEHEGAWATPYQSFDLLAAWQHHVGAQEGIVPFIVTGFDPAGRPLFLWPLGRKQVGSIGVARFLGSKHASYNIGLWRRDLAATITVRDVADMFARLADARHPVDLFALYSQPLSWAGVANPFSLLPRQMSAEDCSCLHLTPAAAGIEGTVSPGIQSRLRGKERKLKKLAGYRYIQATDAADIDRLLDAFFALKAIHMRAQGLTNVFADPSVAAFVRQACHIRRADGRPLIEMHALEGDGEVLALYGAVVDPYRFSAMFNTYTLSAHARHSPGLVLLQHMIGACAERGARSFDIGVGRAHYKSFFCKEPEPLFDTFLPLTPRGRLAAGAFRSAFFAKRMIKTKPALWAAVQFLRRARAG
jgi:CelD/BcsL family acetyltransferase involved in cellulose biosynthesis